MRRTLKYVAFVFVSLNFLVGCSPITGALLDTAKGLAFASEDAPPEINTHLQQERMLIKVKKSNFFITRVHSLPASLTQENAQGKDELWVTPGGEILRFSEAGRLVGSFGSAYADWPRVYTSPIPNWRVIREQLENGRPVQYIRYRDVEPRGYTGIRDKVDVYLIDEELIKNKISYKNKKNLFLFEEHSTLLDAANRLKKNLNNIEIQDPLKYYLPLSRFLVSYENNKNGEVIYSEQCISAFVCFSLQKIDNN